MQGNRSLTLLTVPVADREQSVQIRIRGEWLFGEDRQISLTDFRLKKDISP